MRTHRPKSHLSSALSFIAILFLIWYSFYGATPSASTSNDVPSKQWSTARALNHVKALSVNPHYVGSTAHDQARDYIINQLKNIGLHVTTQQGYTLDQWGNLAKPNNIITRIKGTQPDNKALLLLSHYDSDPHSSLGASDAASGVATILEGIRAFIAQGQAPKNDIIICITDAEELGLNGAELFVNKHPWAQDIGMVLNFEARGSGGPSYMLVETNGGNRRIIEAFNNANTDYPVANSIAYSIYKMIPNNTDLTIFREDGNINGLNFAFIGDHYDYHTALDSYERLDRNTLAHQGAYLMPLLQHFSNIDLKDGLHTAVGDDLVYFPLPFIGMISFPFAWLAALIIGSGILLLILVSYGIKKRKLRWRDIASGFLPLLGSMIIGFLMSKLTWSTLKGRDFYIDQLHGFPYNGYWLIAIAALFTATLCFFLYHKYYNKHNIASLSIAPIFLLWLICLLVVYPVGDAGMIPGVYLPGAGFLLVPVFMSLIMLWMNINQHRPSYLLMLVLSLPAIFIFTPFIKAFPVALGMKILFVASLLTALLIGLLTPIFGHYRRKDLLAFLGLIATVVCVVLAFAKANFSPSQPQSTSLIYVANQDAQTAQWATYDRNLSTWTKEKLGEHPSTAQEINKNTIDSKYGTGFSYVKNAKYIALDSLKINKTKDSIYNNLRHVKLNVSSHSTLQRLEVFCDTAYTFNHASINGITAYKVSITGHAFPKRYGNRMLSYYIVNNEPLELELVFDKNQEPELQFYGASFDLLTTSSLQVSPRPLDQIPMPFVLNDAVLRKRYIQLESQAVINDSITQQVITD